MALALLAGSSALRADGTQPAVAWPTSSSRGEAPALAVAPRWAPVPRVAARLTARDLGLVINTADPYSVEVGAYYAERRGLSPQQILRVELPLQARLSRKEFEALDERIRAHFGPNVQALALAWTQPYAVGCNSITSAITLGYDGDLCDHSCGRSRPSPYFNSASGRPFTDHRVRPSMLVASRDVAGAKRLIDRGINADGTLGLLGATPVTAHFVITGDSTRNVRSALYPAPQLLRRQGIEVKVDKPDALGAAGRVLLYQTGLANVPGVDRIGWVDGALADHLTSFGGRLDGGGGQMSVLEWIDAGATASYGSVSEPCNHLQKFPHPQVLLQHYVQGSTAIEAYWKSVGWPQQGVFVGEPLAAPFSRR